MITTALIAALPPVFPLAAGIGPFLFPLIVLVIWAIRATKGAASAQEQRERAARQRLAQSLSAGAPPRDPTIPKPSDRFQFPTRLGQPSAQSPSQPPPVFRPPPPLPAPRPIPPMQVRSQSRQTKRPPAPDYRIATPPQHPSPIPARPPAAARLPSDRAKQPAPAAATAPPVLAAKPIVAAGVGAPSIACWMRPRTLRAQFILTEIFQPPLAMRDLQY
jgi:hypothetical protein